MEAKRTAKSTSSTTREDAAVGAARGTPRPPFCEGCSPSPLAPSYASAAAANVPGAEDVGAASASAKRRSSKGKGSRGGGGGSGSGGGGSSGGSGGSGGGGSGGSGGGSGGVGGGGGGSGGIGGSGGGGTGGGRTGARHGGSGGGHRQQQQRRSETQSPQQLRRLHTQHRCFSRLDDAWRAEFGDEVERSRWADLLRSGVAIFDLDFDVILSVMYALSASAEGDCYRCVPPDRGIAAAALGASESVLPRTAPAEALQTFMLDSSASRCFFRDSTTLTPLPAPVPVQLADPSEGPVIARSSTVLPCPAVPFGSLSGLHLPSFSTNLVAPPCSCRLLTHPTLLWHHRLGHPSLPCLRGMHSRLLVFGLPRSLPPLPPLPAPPCLPCVEGRQRTRPVVDDYTRYTTVFPFRSKGQVVDVLIPWIRTVHLQLRERFSTDLFVLRLHSDRGGEFSSDLLREFCRGEGILQSFTLPASPQQNRIAERRIGLVMEVTRTSMIHAAAPHFLWPFAVRYAAHQLNLWPRVSLPETSPTLCWTGLVGDASVFRVWGSRAFVRDTSADKLSARAVPCVFLGFVRDARGWQFYHPTLRHVFLSQDVTFDQSVPFHHLFPYCSAPPPPPPLFLAPGPPPVDPLPPQGPVPSGVSQVGPLPGPALVEVAVGSGDARGAASGGAELGGAESEGAGSGGVEPGGAEPEGVEPRGAELEGAESGGAEPQCTASSGSPAGASPRLSPQQLREWLVWRARLQSGATRAGGAGDAGAGGARVTAVAGGTRGAAAAGPGGARTRGTGAAETGGVGGAGAGGDGAGGTGARGAGAGGAGVGGTGAGGAPAGGAGAVDPGGTVRLQPYFVPLLQKVLGVPSSIGLTPPLLCPPLDQSQLPLQPASPLPTPSPYTEQSDGLTDRCEAASRPVSPFRTTRRVPHLRPPPVPGMHAMALCPSSVPLRFPLPAPPEFSLSESAAAFTLVVELLDFAAACRLAYASALIAESESASPPSVGGECALRTDVLEDKHEDFECLAAAVPCFASMLLAPQGDPDAPDIPTPRS
ncbi:unnamed protein product [Closterium sp. NIES-53]